MPKSRSKRQTHRPPPKAKPKRSPAAVPALFFTLLLTGMVIIIGNYVEIYGDTTSNWRLWYGLGLISASFIVATRLH